MHKSKNKGLCDLLRLLQTIKQYSLLQRYYILCIQKKFPYA